MYIDVSLQALHFHQHCPQDQTSLGGLPTPFSQIIVALTFTTIV